MVRQVACRSVVGQIGRLIGRYGGGSKVLVQNDQSNALLKEFLSFLFFIPFGPASFY